MRCETSKRMISDALDGALPPEKAARLENHLRNCAACRAYRGDLALLQGSAQGLADTGLSAADWEDWSRRLDRRLTAGPKQAQGKKPDFFRWKWAWAGAGFIVLIFAATYLAVLRPRGEEGEAGFVSFDDSVAQVLEEIGVSPDLENSFNQEILASIDEAIRPADEDLPVSFGDNPFFWEGLSEGELGYIESELKKEQGHGGLI